MTLNQRIRDVKSAAGNPSMGVKHAAISRAQALLVATACVLALAPTAAQAAGTRGMAQARSQDQLAAGWTRTLNTNLSPRRLHLPADASPQRLARAALARHARRLGLNPSLSGLRLGQELGAAAGAGPLRVVRFRQTVGGVRVVWSQIDVAIFAGKVRAISATIVPVKSGDPGGPHRIDRARALSVARHHVPGRERTLSPQLVAYAGWPTTRKVKRRAPRLAFVVEAMPVGELGEHSPTPLCVVIDAASGKVIATWKGRAARPPEGRRDDSRTLSAAQARAGSAAVVKPILIINNAQGQSIPPGIASLYASWQTSGDPLNRNDWPAQPHLLVPPPNPDLDEASFNARDVIAHMCFTRHFCGRGDTVWGPDRPAGQSDDVWDPFLLTGNLGGSDGYYEPSEERVYLSAELGRADDVIAHELGHHIDLTHADDRIFTFEAQEVQEGLADMFAYDYDRGDATLAEDIGIRVNWANPFPSQMRDYACDAQDIHANATILSHAYYRFVQKVGHPLAGYLLHYVPPALPPQPTFFAVKDAFLALARATRNSYPQLFPAARQAFVNEVGIGVDLPAGSGCAPQRRGERPGPVVPPTEDPTPG